MSCVQLLGIMAMFFLAIHTELPDCEKRVWRIENKQSLGLLCCQKNAYFFQGGKITAQASLEQHCPREPKKVDVERGSKTRLAAPIVFSCGSAIFIITIVWMIFKRIKALKEMYSETPTNNEAEDVV